MPGTDVVMTFSFETLDDARARGMARPPDRLLQSLSLDTRVGKLLAVDASRAPWSRSRWRVPHPRQSTPDPWFRARPVSWSSRPPRTATAARAWVGVIERAVRASAALHALEAPLLVTFNPLLAAFGSLRWARDVVFYARDDWAAYPPHRHLWPLYEVAYEELRKRRRLVCAVSPGLLERIGAGGMVVPNGLDPREWDRPSPRPGPGPPLFAYAGVLDDRIDVALVRAVAEAVPEAEVVLAGPVLDDAHVAPLSRLPNVRLLGSLSRPRVVDLLMASNVGLVPHRRTELTERMSPLKLYEYLAAGCRVVGTDLAPMRGVDPAVELRDSPSAFAAAARDALVRGRLTDVQRTTFVETNSWASRHADMLTWALRAGGPR